MNIISTEALISFLFVTIVCSALGVSAGIRAKKNWKVLNNPKTSSINKILNRVYIIFDAIILVASIIFYLVFIFNIGR